jgi:hypothetical protein
MSSPLWPVRHVTVSIARPPGDVYRFVANPENISRWAQGLASAALQREGDKWVADSPMGRVSIRFCDPNPYGVVDHDVTLPSGETVHNPMRVLPNATGSEVVFSVFRREGVSDDKFEADARAVSRDLAALRTLLER